MPSVVKIAGTTLNRASLLVQEGDSAAEVVPADGTKPVIGVTASTARSGRSVTVNLLDGNPVTVAAGAAISVGQPLQIGTGGTVVPQTSGELFGHALTAGDATRTVQVRTNRDGGQSILSIVGSPEGTLAGMAYGQLVLEIDENGVPVTLWRFTGTPGQTTGWKTFGG